MMSIPASRGISFGISPGRSPRDGVRTGLLSRLSFVALFLASLALTTSAQAQNVDAGGFEIGGELGDVRIDLPKDGTTPNFWLLTLRPEGIKTVTPQAGPGKGEVFWYLLYTLENPAVDDREIFLSITASSDRGVRYADMYLPFVEAEIERKERRSLWGKVDEFKAAANRDPGDPEYQFVTIEAGAKRKSVAVFKRLDRNANHIKIRIRGLSNEVRRREGPQGVVLEEQVLELTFHRPGDEFGITRDSFYPVGHEWVTESVPLGGASEETSS